MKEKIIRTVDERKKKMIKEGKTWQGRLLWKGTPYRMVIYSFPHHHVSLFQGRVMVWNRIHYEIMTRERQSARTNVKSKMVERLLEDEREDQEFA